MGCTLPPQVLLLGHPRKDIRDTSRYPPLMQTQVRGLPGGLSVDLVLPLCLSYALQ